MLVRTTSLGATALGVLLATACHGHEAGDHHEDKGTLKRDLWVRQIGGQDDQVVNAIAVDHDGNVIAVGTAYGGVDFGSGYQATPGNHALFVAKYTPQGTLAWEHAFGDPNHGEATANGVAISPSGTIAVVGWMTPPVDFGSGAISYHPEHSRYTREGFILDLGSDGSVSHVHVFGDPTDRAGRIEPQAIVILPNGDRVIAGQASRSIDLGTGPLEEHPLPAAFVARYSPDGKALWAKFPSVESHIEGEAQALAITPQGGLFACGTTDIKYEHKASYLQRLDPQTGNSLWVVFGKFDSCDAVVADERGVFTPSLGDSASVDAFDLDGKHLWTTAAGANALALTGSDLLATTIHYPDHTIQVTKLDAAGHIERSYQTPAGEVFINAFAMATGALYIGGRMKGSADFGTGPLEPAKNPNDPFEAIGGKSDGYVLRLTSPF